MSNMNRLSLLLPATIILGGCTIPFLNIQIGEPTAVEEAATLARIMETGGSAECTITSLEDNSSTRMILSGKKMKIVGMNTGQGSGTMINDSVYTWIWSEGQTTGYKTKIQELDQPSEDLETSTDIDDVAQTYEDDSKYKLDCNQRTVLDSEFVPPTNINFIDASQMIQQTQEQFENFPNGMPTLPPGMSY